jgi:hypothetical protein
MGLKYKPVTLISDAHSQPALSSRRVLSVHASVPYEHDQHVFKGPIQIRKFYAYAQHTRKKLIRMLRYASVPEAYAQQMHQFLTRARVQISS